MRLAAGVYINGMTLIADSWHSMSDNITTLIVLISSKAASKPPDHSHPYGHGKVVDVGSLLMGVVLLGMSTYLIYEGISRFLIGYSIISEYVPLAIVVVVATCVLKEVLARYALHLHRVSGSLLCKADTWHHRVDALTGIAVMPVFVLSMLGVTSILIDLAATAVIAVLIMREGFEISREAMLSLIDTARHDITDRVTQVTAKIKDVVNVHDVRVRNYGGYYYIEMKMHLDPAKTIEEAHKIAEKVENEVRKAMPRVIEVIIHIEPTTPHEW
ncbi:MAG: cation transporter [Desulfurococcales archaeon]|nr:cation transporter [Desulfurococcales archaeon]